MTLWDIYHWIWNINKVLTIYQNVRAWYQHGGHLTFPFSLCSLISLKKGMGGWDFITRFNPSMLLCPSEPVSRFLTLHFMFLMFNVLRWDMIVRFVDIDEIVDHNCLNCLFIIVMMFFQLRMCIVYIISCKQKKNKWKVCIEHSTYFDQ